MWTRLNHQIPLGIRRKSPEEVMRSKLRFVHALERTSNSGNVFWDSKKWLQGRLLCNERWRLNSKLVVKGCQNRKSPRRFFLFQNSRLGKKRKLVRLRTSRLSRGAHKFVIMEKRRQARHRNHLPQDRERDGSLVQKNYAFLKATGEQDSRVTVVQNKGQLSPRFFIDNVMQVLPSFLQRLCFKNRDCTDRR